MHDVIDGPYYGNGLGIYAAVGRLILYIIIIAAIMISFGALLFIETAKASFDPNKPYLETFNATVTAYTAVETCKDRCIMASGKKAYVGAAACPRRIPFGTWVNIDGFGIVVCEDRTALRFDGRFDVFLGYEQSDYQQALQFGKSIKEITINHSL